MTNDESERAKALSDLERATAPSTAAYIMSKLPPNNWNELATKSDLADLATKADLEQFATKADLERLATKDELADLASKMATKDELADLASKMATKDDLADLASKMATKDELYQLELRVERGLHRQTWSVVTALLTMGGLIIGTNAVFFSLVK